MRQLSADIPTENYHPRKLFRAATYDAMSSSRKRLLSEQNESPDGMMKFPNDDIYLTKRSKTGM